MPNLAPARRRSVRVWYQTRSVHGLAAASRLTQTALGPQGCLPGSDGTIRLLEGKGPLTCPSSALYRRSSSATCAACSGCRVWPAALAGSGAACRQKAGSSGPAAAVQLVPTGSGCCEAWPPAGTDTGCCCVEAAGNVGATVADTLSRAASKSANWKAAVAPLPSCNGASKPLPQSSCAPPHSLGRGAVSGASGCASGGLLMASISIAGPFVGWGGDAGRWHRRARQAAGAEPQPGWLQPNTSRKRSSSCRPACTPSSGA